MFSVSASGARPGAFRVCLAAVCGLFFVAAPTGCAQEKARDTARPPSRRIVADVIVSVTNTTSRLQRLSLQVGATELALGEVPGRSSRSFSVPSGAGDSTVLLQMAARDGRSHNRTLSTGFHLASGQRAVWNLNESGRGVLTMR